MKLKILSFFRDPENQHLATWLQTMAVVVGVIIALAQLSSALNESSYKKGETYLEYENEFNSEISRQIGLIYEYHVNLGRISEEAYRDLYPLKKFLEARASVQSFIARVSSCGRYEVCPSEHVDALACSLSKEMYKSLSIKVSWPQEWRIKFSEPDFYEGKINEHCGILDRFSFWFLR